MSSATILKLAESSFSFTKLREEIQSSKKKISASGLVGSGKALLLSYLYTHLKLPFLVLTTQPDEALKIAEDLESLVGEKSVRYFPAWEILPYELRSPHSEIVGKRLEALYGLLIKQNIIVVTTIRAFLEKTIPPFVLKENTINLKIDDTYDLQILKERLVALGFERFFQVEEVGSFSVRGGIVDIFPYTSENPIRIEFFGDMVDSIREFSVLDQRSIRRIDQVVILPRREMWTEEDKLEKYLSTLTPEASERIREELKYHSDIPGLEWMAPLFDLPHAYLLDYFPPHSIIFLDDPVLLDQKIKHIHKEIQKLYQEAQEKVRIAPSPELLLDSPEIIDEKIREFQVVENLFLAGPALPEKKGPDFCFQMGEHDMFASDVRLLRKRIREYQQENQRIFIFCDNPGQKQRLEELLDEDSNQVSLTVGALNAGFSFPEVKLVVLTDHQIFLRYFHKRRKKRFKEGLAISSYSALKPGDFVVHIDFGIGKYVGLKTITVDGRRRECLLLHYQDDDKLYVPIEEFNRVQKFVGKDGAPTLSKLGSTVWETKKKKTKKAIKDMASELIQLYAERKTCPGFAFSDDTLWQKELESSFIYEETPDQLSAIEAIREDMEKAVSMDRLVCGDVGYGKTEVAIRAAFKSVMDGKQVVVLVPTTILAFQHFVTFSERLRDYPLRVEMLSRFKSKKEQKEVVENLSKGVVDIVIGTHRLIQKDIQFRDLGLLIVDEEQRFGVAHKEKLKKLKRLVDVLTLTATPIPRTMQLALFGAKDISIINTPPKDRLPIDTYISKFDPELIAQAILRELTRGGQIYFVHNRVETIDSMYSFLKDLLPQLRIGIAHGQMDEKALEEVMLSFLRKEYQCLLATSIIESGIDIPSVNTMIIDRADRFGLSQLHQLRGRVGRSDHKAYAYLLVPEAKTITDTARKRLKAIEQYTQLGSGFHLAMRDLEIRGAGNLLGPQQHGFIEEVGFDLYCRLLNEAVKELKGEKIQRSPEVKIKLNLDMYIPEDYIEEEKERVEIYRRLAEANSAETMNDLASELKDRFGELPQVVGGLFQIAELKILARSKQVSKISLKNHILELEFSPDRMIKRKDIEQFCRKIKSPLQFSGEKKFKMEIDVKGEKEKILFVKNLLQKI